MIGLGRICGGAGGMGACGEGAWCAIGGAGWPGAGPAPALKNRWKRLWKDGCSFFTSGSSSSSSSITRFLM
jgi:hypothetical protein